MRLNPLGPDDPAFDEYVVAPAEEMRRFDVEPSRGIMLVERLNKGGSSMPTLTVEDLPPQLYETLARRASEARRSVSDEAKQILADTLGAAAKVTHDYPPPELIPNEEISPPCDLPRPGKSERLSCKDGGLRLPDPFTALVEDHAQ